MTFDSSLRRRSVRFDTQPAIEVDRSGAAVAMGTNGHSSVVQAKFIWLDQVRADPELTPLAFMLAYVLANLVHVQKGYAWPSIARLAAECRVTENGIKKVIRRLAERGHLSVELGTGRGKTNSYRWIIKDDGLQSRLAERTGHPPSQRDENEQHSLPLSDEKGATAVTHNQRERDNCGSKKGQLVFQKGVTPVAPTLFNESIHDPIYNLSMPLPGQVIPTAFDDFWRAYPKKVARTDAMRAFERAARLTPVTEIIRGATRYAAERAGEDTRYTKHPATWLNKGCWSDPPINSREHVEARLSANIPTSGSISARMHGDDDYDEVLMRIQQQRNKRGRKWMK
jgi:hypothetical protein